MKREENYKADLLEELRNDADYAAEYLTAARKDSREAFLVALRDVAEARKGMMRVAKEAKVNRENLYRALSREGNPRIETVDSVLEVLGIEPVYRASSISSEAPSAVAPQTATPVANTVRVSGAERYGLAGSTGYRGNLAGTTTMTVDFVSAGGSLYKDVPYLDVLVAAAQMDESQAAEG
jgi:probable addiction module antidote protein